MSRSVLRFLSFISLTTSLLLCTLLTGCSKNDLPEKKSSLDFTVVSGTDIPADLETIINERKKEEFELTYSDNSYLYIIKGYGKQRSGGYNIKIHDFYKADDTLVFYTELFGPKKDATVSNSPSYPYIVIKTEYRDDPVLFH